VNPQLITKGSVNWGGNLVRVRAWYSDDQVFGNRVIRNRVVGKWGDETRVVAYENIFLIFHHIRAGLKRR
jgi:hypothetical protein